MNKNEKKNAAAARDVVDIAAQEQTVTKVWSFFFNCQLEKKDAARDLSELLLRLFFFQRSVAAKPTNCVLYNVTEEAVFSLE